MELSYELDKIPEETQEFVQYLNCLDGAAAKCEELESLMDYTIELYDIMKDFEVPLDEEVENGFNSSRRELGKNIVFAFSYYHIILSDD